ncbi:efflux RND transporter periplasmic adaptor subunit [Virgibacillus sp. NKC19-16]|uniref:efflux RND transporter periplasmic adaptor subunit n=1 Tax=Virgibacillus salidurans TaxID=2831673 RepID=UPI001F33C8E6|nr:efflux RND transporter periplasmic adaptor subunit [Virgibacillus sp. NKC19-16]UJL45953.1 efflux RND transporter periplasmic adaptor subunit [Virgibacillus sp. NKC19-16]
MKRILFGMIAIVLIMLLAACTEEDDTNENEEEEEEIPTQVETVEATEGDLVIDRLVYGRTSPSSTAPVGLQNPGEVDTLEVENGDQVEEDDLIATIATPAGNQDITASAAGEITNLEASEGDRVSTEEPLAVVADLDSMILTFSVTADVQKLFSTEDTLDVVIDDNEYEAEITEIGKMPDDTGLYPVEATVENEDGDILPGMIGEMSVPENRVEESIIVPTEAITRVDDEAFVYVIDGDQIANQIAVTVQETQSDETAIEGEVQAGDEIVVDGQLTLNDGSAVNVVEGE